MEDSALYILLQGAVDRMKGAASWTDLRLALMRMKEKKVKAAFESVFEDLPLEVLLQAERIADKEVFKPAPAVPVAAPAPLAPAKRKK